MRPALHSPLMSVTNAISGMTAVGGILLTLTLTLTLALALTLTLTLTLTRWGAYC